MPDSIEHERRVMSILSEARRQPPEARQAYVQHACGDDPGLCHEILETLQWDDRMGDFLLTPLTHFNGSDRPFEPGTVIMERFEIIREIGEGGMGLVYEAFDRKRNQRIAIKAGKTGFQRLLSPELEGALKVRHRNVCLVNEIHTTHIDGGPVDFLTMELLDGKTLAQRIFDKGRLPQKEALDIACQLCAGLSEAHRSGVIHRDLKSANVMLCQEKDGGCRAVITDFGLATDQDLQTGDTGGTPAYMAPEVQHGEPATKASDIYALGVVLYEMITGHRPVEHTEADEGTEGGPAAPSALVRKLDPAWDEAILPCLALSPKLRPLDAGAVAERLSRRTGKPLLLKLALASFLIAVVGISYYYWQHHRPVRLSNKDAILVADMTNTTGDAVLDDSLRTALTIAIRQSPELSLLSDGKVAATLQMMNRPPGARLTNDVAREVCRRTDSTAVLESSIADIGNRYRIELRAVSCHSNAVLAHTTLEADDRTKIVRTLGEASARMRAQLGESSQSLKRFNQPLDEATSASPEALLALTNGTRAQMRSPAEALNYLKQAVEFDPNLGAAYAGLGILYHNLGQTNLSAVNLRKAYELRNRLTLRQRLAVEAQYYSDVTGELEKVIQTYKTMEEEYPGNWIVHNNLGAIYIKLGKYDEAITQERESLRLLPSAAQSFNNLVLAFNALDRLDESKAAYEDAIARKADSPDIHVNRYLVSFLLRDQDGMQEQLNWAKGKRGVEDEMLSFHADTQGFYGRLVKARERFTDAVSLAKSSNDLETAASWLVKRALLEVEMGYPEQARNDAADALALSHSSEVELLAAMALARAGDTQSAQEIVEKLDRNFPLDVLIQGYWLPAIRAAIALQLGDPQKAISTLAATSPYELGYPAYSQANSGSMYPTYLRGLAYLRSGQGAQAASEFQKMLDHPGVVGNFAIGALAHLQLARAEVMMGDHTAARKSYRNFLALWKDADGDLPLLQQAKAEYSRLE